MDKRVKKFRLFVIIFVTLIGIAFGGWAGLMYANGKETLWSIIKALTGVASGGLSGFYLARLYLYRLGKIPINRFNRFVVWLLGSLIAGLCGVICTTVVHGILTVILVTTSETPLTKMWDGFWGAVIVGCEITGAAAGLVAGGICSLVYVLKMIDKKPEE